MSNIENLASKPADTGRTDRFLTRELDLGTRDTKFNTFLESNINEFITKYPPQESTQFSKPAQRDLQPKQAELLLDIQNKNSNQLLAEGMVKYLIEKSIVTGYGQQHNLEKIITKFSEKYGFSLKTQELLNEVVETYYKNQPIIEDFFKTRKYDPKLVFKDLFGVDMNTFGTDKDGKPVIQVFQGPAGVELFCDNQTVNKVIKYVYSAESEVLGFASVRYVKINGISFPIFYNFNTSNDPGTYFHELGHNWNKMFRYINRVREDLTKDEYLGLALDKIDSKGDYKKAVEDYFKTLVHQALVNFGDECLAKMKSSDTFSDFFDINDSKNPYDYLKNFRESNSNSFNLDKDEYYLRKKGYENISILDTPVNISPATHNLYSLDRNSMIQIRQELFNKFYLKTISDITSKLELILNKKPELRKTLIGTLGLYTEIELWPDILDKIISDL